MNDMNNFDYQEILELRNICDRILDRAGKPDEVVLKALLRNRVCLLAIKFGILSDFFKTYRNIVDQAKHN